LPPGSTSKRLEGGTIASRRPGHQHEIGRLLAQILDPQDALHDEIARGVAEGMRDLGRRIPEDVALVGFDNWEIMSAHARVPLSTVDMDLHEVGRTAAQRLLEAIDGHTSRGVEFLPCRLLPRESTDLTAASSR
jgi:DNA-binding LacI/PurR family transcriptional regulator